MPGRRILPAALLGLLLGAAAAAPPATTLGTLGQWNGVDGIGNFGEPSDATYGQTFTAPGGGKRLSSFTFFVDDGMNPGPVHFQGFVMGWDGSKASGPVLYQSGAMATTNNHGAGGFERFTFTISRGINLLPGATYVAFLSASNLFDGIPGDSIVGSVTPGTYPGGGFVFFNNGNNIAALSTSAWDASLDFIDLAFQLDFAAAAPTATRRARPVLVADQAAIASLLISSVPTALAQRDVALGASRTALRDFNSRLFRRRAGAESGGAPRDSAAAEHTVQLEASGGKAPRQVVYTAPGPEQGRWEVFTSVDYGNLGLESSGDFLGLQSNTWAESLGAEFAASRHLVLGGGASYLESDAGGGTDVTGETVAIYASGVWGGWYADLLYGATFLQHDLDRPTGTGTTAHAQPGSVTQTISFNTGYNFMPGRWSLGPIIGVDYGHAKIDGYTESGGGTSATHVEGQSADSLLTRVGAQASYRIERRWGAIIPQFRLGWERENLGGDDDLNAGLVHSPFYLVQGNTIRGTGAPFEVTVAGQDRERDSINVGAGVLIEIGRRLQFVLDYEGDFLGEGYTAHYGKITLGWKF